jgi:hypothetical protein
VGGGSNAARKRPNSTRARAREGKYHKLQKLDFIIKNQDDWELGLLRATQSVFGASEKAIEKAVQLRFLARCKVARSIS